MITETKLCEYILDMIKKELRVPSRKELVLYTGMPGSQILSSFKDSTVIKHLWKLSTRELSYLVEECSKPTIKARDLAHLNYVLVTALMRAEKDLYDGDGPFVA